MNPSSPRTSTTLHYLGALPPLAIVLTGLLWLSVLPGCIVDNGRVDFIESMFPVASEPPSRLWTDDPRTRGWGSIHVEYWFLTYGGIKAFVRSDDGQHRFTEHGTSVQEHNSVTACGESEGVNMVVLAFHGQTERYAFVYDKKRGYGRMMLVLPDVPSTPPISASQTNN